MPLPIRVHGVFDPGESNVPYLRITVQPDTPLSVRRTPYQVSFR